MSKMAPNRGKKIEGLKMYFEVILLFIFIEKRLALEGIMSEKDFDKLRQNGKYIFFATFECYR